MAFYRQFAIPFWKSLCGKGKCQDFPMNAMRNESMHSNVIDDTIRGWPMTDKTPPSTFLNELTYEST